MADELLAWRKEFPILERKTYLISNSLGAMPRSVFGRMTEFAEIWSEKGVQAWAEDWWDLPRRAGDVIAPLIGAGPGEVILHSNITTMLAVILSALEHEDIRKGRTRVVCEALNFPSVLYLLERWCSRLGIELVLVPSDDGITVRTERMLEAIDERTLAVPISHVLFRSSYIQDVQAITRKAKTVGALVILDAYQSVGVVPVDVRNLEIDVLLGGVLKWLCGGPGGG
ncbi:MAG: aminotransferase class V-fold PLP-dependent enzyme, partial [Bacteroidota bacterium]